MRQSGSQPLRHGDRRSMNDALLRHWVMLSQIPLGRGIDTTTLAERLADAGFPVTQRTVQRDLERLAHVFGLTCDDTSKPYRWAFAAGARAFSLPGMSPAVALVLRMADAHLASLLPTRARESLGPYLRQADAVLRTAGWDWAERVQVLPPGPREVPPQIRAGVLEAVAEAMTTGRRLGFEYLKRSADAPADWDVAPLGIVMRAPTLYLVAAPEDRPLQFALHRILVAVVLDTPAVAPPGFDLGAFASAAQFGYRLRSEPICLRLRVGEFSEPDFLERPLSDDQRATRGADGALIVEATVDDTMDLRAFLLSLGSDVEVLGPPDVRTEIAGELRAAVAGYGRIASDPAVCHGRPSVRGTRVPVTVVLDNLAAGLTPEEIVASYSSLTVEDVRETIAYAAEVARAKKGRRTVKSARQPARPQRG